MDSTTLIEKQREILTTSAARALFAPDATEFDRFATKVPLALRQRIRKHCIAHDLTMGEFLTQAVQERLPAPEAPEPADDGRGGGGWGSQMDPIEDGPVGAQGEPREGLRMVFPQCPKCPTGVLLPLSDYSMEGATILFKAWVCAACGFGLRVDRGVITYTKVSGVRVRKESP